MSRGEPPTAPGGRGQHRLCPNCGAGMAEDQDWCIECGHAATTRVVTPPSWKLPVAVIGGIVALFLVGTAVAVKGLSDDSGDSVADADPAAQTEPAQTPARTTPDDGSGSGAGATDDDRAQPAATGAEEEGADSGATGATGATGPTGDQSPAGATPKQWDPDDEAYTVVLVTSDRSGAERVAKAAAELSDAPTGILETTRYDFFSPNLWIAWAGVFEDKPDAEDLAQTLAEDGRRGYVTLVRKK